MPSSVSASAASLMVGQSEVEPIMMPINGDMADKRPCQKSKVKCQKWCGAGRLAGSGRMLASSPAGGTPTLRQNGRDDLAFDVGQAEAAALELEGQLFVVDAHEFED